MVYQKIDYNNNNNEISKNQLKDYNKAIFSIEVYINNNKIYQLQMDQKEFDLEEGMST